MNSSFAVLALLGALLPPAAPAPIAGDCRMSVWLIAADPDVYDWECLGDCNTPYNCTERWQEIGDSVSFYCKCLYNMVPPQPDSTACTSIVTFNQVTAVFDVYCVDQSCPSQCFERTITFDPVTPCFCDD
jgi:hypothetical protein